LAGPESLCVYCRERPIDPAWRPFCGERCKLADLGRWFSGDYRVPAESAEGDAAKRPASAVPDTDEA